MAYVDIENGLFVGNIGNIYELRRVGENNRSVIDFSIACTPRYRNSNGEWEEGEVHWENCTAWGQIAEHIQESYSKGDRVFVKGRRDVKKAYTKDDGTEIPERPFTVVEYTGPELFWNSVTINKKSGGGKSSGGGSPRPASNGGNTTSVSKSSSKPAPKAAPADDLGLDSDFDIDDFDDEQPF